jgi:fucose 4-O-acetylase-like acetyltransferase
MGKRVDLIDVAKGISIMLVAFHHSKLSLIFQDVSGAMGLFRMPLFFFLSGVFFSALKPPKDFFIHKTDALLKPYFATLTFLLIISIVINQDGTLKEAAGILYGTGFTIDVRWLPMWFLTHLWALFMFSYLLVRLVKNERRSATFNFLFIIALFVLGVILLDFLKGMTITVLGEKVKLPGLPFSVDFIFLSMTFFLSGHLLNRKVKGFVPNLPVLAMLIGVFLYIASSTGAVVDLHGRVYKEPVLATLAAFSGIYMVLSFSYYVSQYEQIKRFFKVFGSASLFILIFHGFIVSLTYNNLAKVLPDDWHLFAGTVAYVASITLPLYLKTLFSQITILRLFYFPFKRERLAVKQQSDAVS